MPQIKYAVGVRVDKRKSLNVFNNMGYRLFCWAQYPKKYITFNYFLNGKKELGLQKLYHMVQNVKAMVQ